MKCMQKEYDLRRKQDTFRVPCTPRGFGGGSAGGASSGLCGCAASAARRSLASSTSASEKLELGLAVRPAGDACCAGAALTPRCASFRCCASLARSGSPLPHVRHTKLPNAHDQHTSSSA